MSTSVAATPATWGCLIEIAPGTAYPSIQARELFRRFSMSAELQLETAQPEMFPGTNRSEAQIDRQFSYVFKFRTMLARDEIRQAIAGIVRGVSHIVKVKLGGLRPAVPEPMPAPVSRQADQAAPEPVRSVRASMRVDLVKIEELVNLIGELIINKNQVDSLSGVILGNSQTAQEMKVHVNGFHNARNQLGYVTGKLRDLALGIRMVPVSQITRKFPAAVREMARKTGKQIRVLVEGEETELDKAILEEIADPLMHIIRNAADHGIETPQARQAKGKYPEGTILIRAEHEGDRIAIFVEDDGGGLDEARILQKAVERGILTAKAAAEYQQREIHQLIFAPGFSTAEKVSELSGRGVGMDVVKNNISRLSGVVEVESGRDVGTRITLKLPLTLSILEGLLLEDAGQTYAIPLIAIEKAYLIDAEKVKRVGRYYLMERDGETLPVFRVAELFGHGDLGSEENYYLVEASSSEGRFGLIVQKILGRQEIVLKPLGDYLGKVTGVSGSTILGNGKVALILDTKTIAASVSTAIRNGRVTAAATAN